MQRLLLIGAIKHSLTLLVRRMRRDRPNWMERSHEAVLEFLFNGAEPELISTPAVIEANIDYSLSTVNLRLSELLRVGLVQYYDEGRAMYELTDLGKDYLTGQVSGKDLPELEKEPDD